MNNKLNNSRTRAAVLAAVAASSLMLAGCGSDIKVTAEQNDLIAEYAAGTLMKYSYQNEWKYSKLNANITNYQRPAQTQNTIPQQPAKPSQQGSNTVQGTRPAETSGSMADIAEAFGMKGIAVSYSGCTVSKTYPEGEDILTVRATSGRDIVAVEFNLNNTSSEEVVCNTVPLSVVMKLSVNGMGNVTEYATMLKNDINTLNNVTIKPGETYKAVALFMLPEGKADNITGLELTLAGEGVRTSKIKLR